MRPDVKDQDVNILGLFSNYSVSRSIYSTNTASTYAFILLNNTLEFYSF